MNPHIISTFILISHWIIVVGLSIWVIMRRSPIGVSMAWLAVIFSVPFVGAAVYLMFGEKRLGRTRAVRINASIAEVFRWQKALRERYDATALQIDHSTEPLLHYVERVLGFPALPGNHIELLSDFQSIFDRLVADIDAARSTVHLCFYIWHGDGRTADIVDALIRAAKRGVQCRALADAMGSKAFLESPQVSRLREAGIDFAAALPTGLLRMLVARRDLRNHRKIAVIDDCVAYSGSQNLVDPRFFKQALGVGEWVDAMVRITGPAAASLDGVFRLDWSVETGAVFEAPPAFADGSLVPSESLIQIVPSGPDLRPEAIHQLLLTAIYAAQHELIMTTPYFVPDESILTALLTAALRGVEVTLIVPARNDSVLVRYASAAHFHDLMSAGVRIALFNGGLLHTKSLTIDDDMSVFGSVNLDMRSIWLDFEISLLVYDRSFTGQLRLLQNTYLQNSEKLNFDTWRQRPAWCRFVENTCRLVGPLL
jgi:cardiolipin synthase A/B